MHLINVEQGLKDSADNRNGRTAQRFSGVQLLFHLKM